MTHLIAEGPAWLQWTGIWDPTGAWYSFWSGLGGANWPVLGVLIVFGWHHNCSHGPCWRLSRHLTPEGYRLCHKHIRWPRADLRLHEVHEDHQA